MKKYLMMVRFGAGNEWVIHQEFETRPELLEGVKATIKFGHGGMEAMFVEVLDPTIFIRFGGNDNER